MRKQVRPFMIEVLATCIGACKGMGLYMEDKRRRRKLREKQLFG